MAIEGGLKNFLEIVFVFLSPGVTLTKPTLVNPAIDSPDFEPWTSGWND